MLDLYREYPGEMHLYVRRRPRRDGQPPLTSLLIAAALFIPMPLFLMTVYGGLIPARAHSSYWAGGICLSIFCIIYIAGQFEKLVFSVKTGRVYRCLGFFRLRIARFEDLGELRMQIQEIEGRVLGHYVAVWRDQPLRCPLALTMRCTSRQSKHYRHTIVPHLRELVFPKHAADVSAAEAQAVAVEEFEVTGASSVSCRAGLKMVRKSFKRHLWTWLVVGLLWRIGAFVFLAMADISHRTVPVDNYVSGAIMAGVLFARIGVYILIILSTVRFVRYLFSLNQLLVVDAENRTIRGENLLGTNPVFHSFDSMIEFTVKYVGRRRLVCMVMDQRVVDLLAGIAWSEKGARDILTELCEMMGLDINEWLDVLIPRIQYSEEYKKRILKSYDPYYEG